MDAITALHSRRAAPRLTEPAPSARELEQIYQAALRAPDHAMLRPWRFLTISGEGRIKLGELFAEAMPSQTAEERSKLLNAPLRAPMIIIAVAQIVEHPKVPPVEQISSTAAAVQNMSLAAHALGYASIWRTGKAAFDPVVKKGLGLSESDEIVGLLYLGTATVNDRPVPEMDSAEYFEAWPAPENL
ncbi:MAG: nitroreductase [Gammaproteobacteria bacterium]|nr:nitroreductase [Gammaproteobacteria bacterium]MAY02514.1 nitroreductase [Gammaproteobacteria bacterium]|tara:strand:+ start:3041 stop:3601 length:561 start_codon:yes stop_codon:yes gene_type:complete